MPKKLKNYKEIIESSKWIYQGDDDDDDDWIILF
jgi:hypothetical protein